ncbi:hypothetical protein AAFG13_17895 [Bradyrhizobium sp. B124]
MTKEQLARDAVEIFRLRAYRSIKDRETRRGVVEAVEAVPKTAQPIGGL